MVKMNNSSTISSNSSSNTGSNISKLRRLKIQENVLTANLQKSLCSLQQCCADISNDTDIILNNYLLRLKESYNEIKYLYEDIKARTNVEGHFDKFDMNEIKTDILQLETKIKLLKDFLRNELISVQTEEEKLINKVNEISTCEKINTGRKKTRANTYNEIIPSPVRAMINSPFKCKEVHQYQEFLKNSVNRYGGWNEYNHNMFVQIWNKYYKDQIVESIDKLTQYDEFKHEILQKNPEIYSEDIIAHSNWYCEYVFLKIQQQNALSKWQDNKRKIKKRDPKPVSIQSTVNSGTVPPRSCKKNSVENNRKMDNLIAQTSHLLKPTQQWINRCRSEEKFETNLNIGKISKLRIPNWRVSLQ